MTILALRPAKYGGFTLLSGGQYQKTLVGRLIPCVDPLRDLLTKAGLRPYIVRLVFTRWSMGERGWGTEEVVSECHILPTPKVLSMESLDNTTTLVGSDEFGSVRVEQISGRFTEDELMGRTAHGGDVPDDTNFYYEIEFPNPDGTFPGIRRRFEVSGTPTFAPGRFQWTIELVRAGENRTRAQGTPED